ncbi:MAG: hypothetical protein IJK64_02195 [Clostridia bacterium]|nr:hypothetical protein [Clostridia bacterium]
MNQTAKRSLACLLAALMLCASLPLAAFAGGAEDPDSATWQTYIAGIEPVDAAPAVALSEFPHGWEITDSTFPRRYLVTYLDGATYEADASGCTANNPTDGIYFTVPAGEDETLTVNAFFRVEENAGYFVLAEYHEAADTYAVISVTPCKTDLEAATLLVRIRRWLDDLQWHIRFYLSWLKYGIHF